MSDEGNVPWYVADYEKPMWKDRLVIAQTVVLLLLIGATVASATGDRDAGLSLLVIGLLIGQEVSGWWGKRSGWRRARGAAR